ncbi:MAG TPA: hypothetical protein VFU47_16070 [Armatimonadota bacterium]|nr:hypothetical protein [Armatimonadota bacterium]
MDQEPSSHAGAAPEPPPNPSVAVQPDPTPEPPELEPAAHNGEPEAALEPVVRPHPLPPADEEPHELDAEGEPEREAEPEPSPNWMLAFVSAWAGGFAFYEAWDVLRRVDLSGALRTMALGGYGLLGAGLFLCALEALLWGRLRRRGAAQVLLLLLPLILIALGLLLLIMFKDPDPTRSKI